MGTLPTNHKLCFNMYQIIMNFTLSLNKKDPRASLPISGGRAMCNETTHVTRPYHIFMVIYTVYPKKYAHGFCFAVLCCGYTLTDFPISNRLTSLALWQSNDCPSVNKATLMNMDKYFMWIHYERLHNHNKAKHNKTVCIFLGIYCMTYGHGKAMAVHKCYALMYSVIISANA